MKLLTIATTAVAALSLSTAVLSVASEPHELTDPDYLYADGFPDVPMFVSFVKMQLVSLGYREIRMSNGQALRLSALDKEGSQVLLTIDEYTGAVRDEEYLHRMDE
jgi:hypothetical protein